jgi:phage N-6-adenine-methyltransferase
MTYVGLKGKNRPAQLLREGRSLDEVDDRATPPELFAQLDERFGGFTLDVAASADNARCERYFDREADGLSRPWTWEQVWCNPPFSTIEPWLEKAWGEWYRGAMLIVMLLPANRTDQPWWQRWVEPSLRTQAGPLRVEFLPGRIKFLRPGQSEPGRRDRPLFGCCLLIWSGSRR